ncbi:hypothetical protein B0H19DRAFT_1084420 [Mycena capillaripes]|nr:hypothetical protein B0H19DRAFT_1084420 [Mycena capillaripes]
MALHEQWVGEQATWPASCAAAFVELDGRGRLVLRVDGGLSKALNYSPKLQASKVSSDLLRTVDSLTIRRPYPRIAFVYPNDKRSQSNDARYQLFKPLDWTGNTERLILGLKTPIWSPDDSSTVLRHSRIRTTMEAKKAYSAPESDERKFQPSICTSFRTLLSEHSLLLSNIFSRDGATQTVFEIASRSTLGYLQIVIILDQLLARVRMDAWVIDEP